VTRLRPCRASRPRVLLAQAPPECARVWGKEQDSASFGPSPFTTRALAGGQRVVLFPFLSFPFLYVPRSSGIVRNEPCGQACGASSGEGADTRPLGDRIVMELVPRPSLRRPGGIAGMEGVCVCWGMEMGLLSDTGHRFTHMHGARMHACRLAPSAECQGPGLS
jgi:hypothetical protein